MTDEQYMQRCLILAEKGICNVAPNPMVGCVIVHDGKIIGEGYHQQYGEAHAEVNAINSVSNQDLLKTSTLYVNLEPCAHFGKTPPCANLIIEKEIPKVVVGCVDTYAKVSGLGIRNMKLAGCEVIEGVLENESRELNKRFLSFHTRSKPYVILKWAQSKDGYMDIDRSEGQKGTFWITQAATKALVHKWRSEESAILVGKNTIMNDDPALTVREIKGPSPIRFIIDPDSSLDISKYKVAKTPPETMVIQQTEIADILQELRNRNLISVLVEGGKFTLEKFLESGLWDEIRVLTGNTALKEGLKSPDVQGRKVNTYNYGDDLVEIYRND